MKKDEFEKDMFEKDEFEKDIWKGYVWKRWVRIVSRRQLVLTMFDILKVLDLSRYFDSIFMNWKSHFMNSFFGFASKPEFHFDSKLFFEWNWFWIISTA